MALPGVVEDLDLVRDDVHERQFPLQFLRRTMLSPALRPLTAV